MPDSSLQHEATDTANTVEHFGRSWELPAAVRYNDHKRLNEIAASQMIRNWDVVLVEAFLSADDLAELAKINPTSDELDEFGDKIAQVLGFKGSGNS